MGPLLGALLSVGIPAISDIVGGLISRGGQRRVNDQNVALAREQMAFQERMSSTAYQRAMGDMRAAGLNPMLAYMQGGASAPQGAMATMQNPEASLGSSVENAVSSAMSALKLRKELELLSEQTRTQKNVADKTFYEAQVAGFETALPDVVVGPRGERIENTFWGQNREAMMAQARANAASARASARLAEEELPGRRLRNVPGRLWRFIGDRLMPAPENMGSSAWQRFNRGMSAAFPNQFQ